MAKLKPLLFLLLAGCATVPAFGEEPYRALGTEPFWSITIENGRMTYDAPEGGFSVRAPRGQETGDGRIWESRRITLHIWHQECSDGMSDNLYPQTVRAVVDGRELSGCGGEPQEPPTFAGTRWAIVEIDGRAVEGEAYWLEIGGERISGQAGCNRFSGPYSQSGDTLSPGPLATTRMACPGGRMEHEGRALAILQGAMVIDTSDDGGMTLMGDSGALRLRRTP